MEQGRSSNGKTPATSKTPVDRNFETWLIAAREGSNSAVGKLLQGCRDYLLLVANAEIPGDVRQKVSPSDVVQETLADGFADFGRFQGDHLQLRMWLASILRNNVADAIKRYRGTAKRSVRRELEQVDDRVADKDLSPSGHALLAEKRRLVLESLKQLPAGDQSLIVLRNLEYQSFETIGEQLGISSDAARKRWERAMERFGGLMESHRESLDSGST